MDSNALRRALIAAAVALVAIDARAQAVSVQGSCRDGAPHGAWQLAAAGGQPRAIGAFSKGRRTGSFIFWNALGNRIAHLPYEEGLRNGTAALWFETPALPGGDGPQRLEAVYANGLLNGVKRKWHPDGQRRGEYVYAKGVLEAARAWDARGRALGEAGARAQADADQAADERLISGLEALAESHVPRCAAAVPPQPH